MSNDKTKYPVEMDYRGKKIVLLYENRNDWAYLDDDGEPTKNYNSPAEVKAAIDRKLDAVAKGKKFERVRVFSFDRPGVVYEVTSIKKGGYGGPVMRGTIVEVIGSYERGYHTPVVGAKDRISIERYNDYYLVEGNEEFQKDLIARDAVIVKLQAERLKTKKANRLTAEFFDKRGDFDD